ARGDQGTQDEPAVRRTVASIEQHEIGCIRYNIHTSQRVIDPQGYSFALGERQRLSVSLGLVPIFQVVRLFRFIRQGQNLSHRIIRRTRKYTSLVSVNHVSLSHVDRGQELQVESCASHEILWQRLIQIDADLHTSRLRCHLQRIAKVKRRESKVGGEAVVRLVGM